MKKNPEPSTAVAVIPPVKVPKLKTGDDAEVAAKLTELFNEAQNGIRRIVAFGLYAEEIKLTKLRHKQFGAWVQVNCPFISYRSVRAHMQLAESVLESAGFKSTKVFLKKVIALQNGSSCHFENAGELLLLPEKNFDKDAIEIRSKVFEIIDGKSARQLFLEFKQAEEDEDGSLKKKVGRVKGKGGATVEQRAKAKALEEAARIEAIQLKGVEFIEWIDENCDDKNIGAVDDDKWRDTLRESAHLLISYLNHKKDGK